MANGVDTPVTHYLDHSSIYKNPSAHVRTTPSDLPLHALLDLQYTDARILSCRLRSDIPTPTSST